MKLPFDLGVKLILRLLIPGFLLTAAVYPALAAIREAARWGISMEYLFILSSIVTGWLVLSLDQPIYMLFEGRRYWPASLRRLLTSMEKNRLTRLLWAEEEAYRESESGSDGKAGKQRNAEAWVELRSFPLDDQGKPVALLPTRLGNLVFAFETYPDKRYGADAIFYWYRIWLMLDKDLREEIDSRQAMADSGLYAAAVLTAGGVFWTIYALVMALTTRLTATGGAGGYAKEVHAVLGKHLPGTGMIAVIALTFFVLAAVAYRMSLFPQAQYGETFKALFDLHESRIDVARVVSHVATVTRHPQTTRQERRENLTVAWRYLHNHRVKCPHPGCEDRSPVVPEEFADHLQKLHGVPPSVTPSPSPAPTPAPASFFSESASLTRAVRTINQGKRLLWLGGAVALTFGIAFRPAVALAASAGALVGILVEQRRWNALSPRITSLRAVETAQGTMHLFESVDRNRWKRSTVLLPYLVLFTAGVVVFLVGYLG